LHIPLLQSFPTAQVFPSAQALQSVPPQSMSVSLLLTVPSKQPAQGGVPGPSLPSAKMSQVGSVAAVSAR